MFERVFLQALWDGYWCLFVLQLLLMQRFSKC